jgi:hypothetical protein
VALAAATALGAGAAWGNKHSNPAFLGIGMQDLGGVAGAGPCAITSIEPGSGAAAAHLRPGDVLDRLDGLPVPSCDALVAAITARAPGAVVALELRRDGMFVRARAELLARDEILRRRLVGHRLPVTELVRVDDGARVDLGDLGRPTVIGWYPQTCGPCGPLLDQVARWSAERAGPRRPPIAVLGATSEPLLRQPGGAALSSLQLAQRGRAAVLLAAEPETYARFAMRDADRVHFMVIDHRGVVAYVAPVVPDTDDTRAMLDELYAAAEQIARRHAR